jgi:Flp pilus assembly protein TadG
MTQAFNLSQLANRLDSTGHLDASTGLINGVPFANGGTGGTSASTALISLGSITSLTGSQILPAGTASQRDSSPNAGYIRFNTDIFEFEGYNGTNWTSVGGGATGGGSDQVFFQNGQVVTTSYTITTGTNAMSAGPITINTGVTVTVPTDSTWVIV